MSTHIHSNVEAVAIDDLSSLFDGVIKLARAGLGISAFGVRVLGLPPDYLTTPTTSAPPARRSSTASSPATGPPCSTTDRSPHRVRNVPGLVS
jgi:hypothetical protein